MTQPDNDTSIDHLIAAYLDGTLNDTDRPVFEAWLKASPKNPRRVAHLAITEYAIREVCRDTKADYLLQVLAQIDRTSGPTQLVTLHHIQPAWHRYRLHAVLGTIAAVLLIALTIILTLQGPTTQTDGPSVVDSNPRPRSIAPKQIVATLTNTHNAVWATPKAERALARGSALKAGDKLTLTQGFAEITTNRGAIAILQAPATFELLNNDNAIHLHQGKLVGICETDTSKGFRVRTPHMDITDLGTRFGVDASDPSETQVHVFEGEVEVKNQANNALTQNLTAGHALMTGDLESGLVEIQMQPTRFALVLASERIDHPPSAAQAGIVSMSGNIAWSDTNPGNVNAEKWPVSPKAVVYKELVGQRLGADVQVSYNLPGVYTKFDVSQPSSTIPQGTKVHSFFIAHRHAGPELISGSGRITFEGEILGIITHGSTGQSFLDATSDMLDSVIQMSGGSLESGNYDPENISSTDMIEIGQDRRTLSFALQGVIHLDYFRVIVRAPGGQEHEVN